MVSEVVLSGSSWALDPASRDLDHLIPYYEALLVNWTFWLGGGRVILGFWWLRGVGLNP